INQSSGQGALFELIARGVKDNYFVKDDKNSIFPYDASYGSSMPHLAERRTTVPITRTDFGRTFEVEIDAYGDIMTECAFEIDLPSWLPPMALTQSLLQPLDPSIVNNLYPITAADGASYGYTNGVGYFLFESIQFYQDQFLLQEWSGDMLYAKQLTEGSYGSAGLAQQSAGVSAEIGSTERSIQMRATPGHLRIYLPLPGMQCPGDPGFPLTALPYQTFRIKATLRKLEDLVVCSNPAIIKPAPWSQPSFQVAYPTGTQTVVPLTRLQIGQPTILLSTVQHYISSEDQALLRSKPIQIPFRKQFENVFTFGELDYIPLDKGGQAVVTRYIDGRHPAERLFWFFRNYNALDQNRLDVMYNDYFDQGAHYPTETQPYTTPYGSFYYSIKLNIAGKEREDPYNGSVWNQLVPFAKQERYSENIGSMCWSTGDNYGKVYPASRSPEGTVNFSTADRPTLHVQLANIMPNARLSQRKSEFRVIVESWNMYYVADGRGRLGFAS
ncbi:MAG: hypothetical protein EBU46_18810, partial [Nitrosomonadaceae bacterium]|nr:hypothetical protein [Nitrosomonadaceae bacterium]